MNAEEQEAIFRRWLSDHLGLMLKLVRAGAATPEDQDDLFQEVLVNVWSSIRAFRGEATENAGLGEHLGPALPIEGEDFVHGEFGQVPVTVMSLTDPSHSAAFRSLSISSLRSAISLSASSWLKFVKR